MQSRITSQLTGKQAIFKNDRKAVSRHRNLFPALPLRRHQLLHAKVFAGWAVINLVGGSASMFFSEGQWHHFHHMNAAWGSVNLLVFSFLWYWTEPINPTLSKEETFLREKRFRRFLMVNLCLDLVYIAVGGWIYHQGTLSVSHQSLLRGFGQAILLQGLCLFSIDLTSLFVAEHRQARTVPTSNSLC